MNKRKQEDELFELGLKKTKLNQDEITILNILDNIKDENISSKVSELLYSITKEKEAIEHKEVDLVLEISKIEGDKDKLSLLCVEEIKKIKKNSYMRPGEESEFKSHCGSAMDISQTPNILDMRIENLNWGFFLCIKTMQVMNIQFILKLGRLSPGVIKRGFQIATECGFPAIADVLRDFD